MELLELAVAVRLAWREQRTLAAAAVVVHHRQELMVVQV
jgi:hypothetical protein